MKIVLATMNPHKLDEIRAVFDEMRRSDGGGARADRTAPIEPFKLLSLGDLDRACPEPVEDQATFEGNADLKALHYARLSAHPCLADDSGLEVDALGGEPGVLSARFAGATGSRPAVDEANNALLLRRLGDRPAGERAARFVCAMSLAAARAAPGERPDAQILIRVRGTVEGRILGPGDDGYAIDNPGGRGAHGFGYDPLFVVSGSEETSAELTPSRKNRISHRGEAARRIWPLLVRLAHAG